ncbi:hypothetical protein JCM8547_003861 [Rhodosporidiobolus lusitaniae]
MAALPPSSSPPPASSSPAETSESAPLTAFDRVRQFRARREATRQATHKSVKGGERPAPSAATFPVPSSASPQLQQHISPPTQPYYSPYPIAPPGAVSTWKTTAAPFVPSGVVASSPPPSSTYPVSQFSPPRPQPSAAAMSSLYPLDPRTGEVPVESAAAHVYTPPPPTFFSPAVSSGPAIISAPPSAGPIPTPSATLGGAAASPGLPLPANPAFFSLASPSRPATISAPLTSAHADPAGALGKAKLFLRSAGGGGGGESSAREENKQEEGGGEGTMSRVQQLMARMAAAREKREGDQTPSPASSISTPRPASSPAIFPATLPPRPASESGRKTSVNVALPPSLSAKSSPSVAPAVLPARPPIAEPSKRASVDVSFQPVKSPSPIPSSSLPPVPSTSTPTATPPTRTASFPPVTAEPLPAPQATNKVLTIPARSSFSGPSSSSHSGSTTLFSLAQCEQGVGSLTASVKAAAALKVSKTLIEGLQEKGADAAVVLRRAGKVEAELARAFSTSPSSNGALVHVAVDTLLRLTAAGVSIDSSGSTGRDEQARKTVEGSVDAWRKEMSTLKEVEGRMRKLEGGSGSEARTTKEEVYYARTTITRLEKRLETVQKELEQSKRSAKEVEEKAAKAEAKLEHRPSERVGLLLDKVDKLTTERDDLQTQMNTLQASHDSLAASLEARTTAAVANPSSSPESSAEVVSLLAQVSKLQSAVQRAEESADAERLIFEDNEATWWVQLAASAEKATKAEEKVEESRREREKSERERERERKERDGGKRMEELEREVRRLRERERALEGEIKDKGTSAARRPSFSSSPSDTVSSSELAALRSKLRDAQAESERRQYAIGKLAKQVQELSRQVWEKGEENSELLERLGGVGKV